MLIIYYNTKTLKDMSEHDNLQEADGENLNATPQENSSKKQPTTSEETPSDEPIGSKPPTEASTDPPEKEIEPSTIKNDTSNEVTKKEDETVSKTSLESGDDTDQEVVKQNEEKAAVVNYEDLSLEDLIKEFETLLKAENIHNVRNSINQVKNNFNAKFSALISEKKEAFLAEGGNTIDFHFSSPLKKQFNELSKTFREKHQSYQKNRTQELNQNLEIRLQIIEEIKGLINVEGDINSAYNTFKNLQERWRNTGRIPSSEANNTWNNYRHHVEIFYGFLHLNRDLRELDFKHNLEQKQKIIVRTEELANETDLRRAFRELQALHKIWKEELGPVSKEYKDELWERFSAATKVINDKRQDYYNQLEEQFEENLKIKNEIIAQITSISEQTINSHKDWQLNIKEIESLREAFFKTGKVPSKVNEKTWTAFKDAVRSFNKKKNNYYKTLKKDQSENYKKKLELVEIAEQNKDNEDTETTLILMKDIQSKWKTIGHIPRKDSDKLWKRFRGACNAFFDRYHEQKNNGSEEEIANFKQKSTLLESLEAFELEDDKDKNLEALSSFSSQWKKIGDVAKNKRFIEGKFFKTLDTFYSKLGLNKKALDDLKYTLKLETLSQDQKLFNNEVSFIRKKMDEIKSEINQLENNLQFFSNVEDDNPLVKEVHKNIDKHKAALEAWNAKYSKIKKMIQ
jgi:predicted XRE-type DNA-binding protein